MNRTILQIPLTVDLREKAEEVASSFGFSSLQELVRVFLSKLAKKTLELTFTEKEERLSPKAEKRYLNMMKDFTSGKNIYHAKNFDDFIKQLREN